MDKKKILKWQISAIVFCIIFGSLLHFTYQLSNKNEIIALFSSINESTWEHLKLSFFPIIIFSLIQYFFIGYKTNNYIEAKAISTILSIILITIIFYTYTGIIGRNYAIVDIASFVISIIASELTAYKIMTSKKFLNKETKILAILFILILLGLFVIFTNNPPNINYFKEPEKLV